MPRKPRIDAPGFFYHAIARGIEGREIFRDREDESKFLNRLGELCLETRTPVYAYALIPNHIHLLLRRDGSSVSTFMHRLLTFYAIYFNRKYNRSGHLFQNRYKGVLCQDEIYFLQLLRYINLNPVRAGLIDNLEKLAGSTSSAHGLTLGARKVHWFDPAPVLAFFGKDRDEACVAYNKFIAGGLAHMTESEIAANREIPLGYGELHGGKNLLLPPDGFTEELHYREHECSRDNKTEIQNLFIEASLRFSISREELQGKSRSRTISAARAYLACEMQGLGMSQTEIARSLSVSLPAVSKMLSRGQKYQDAEAKQMPITASLES